MTTVLAAATAMVAAFDYLDVTERRSLGRSLTKMDREGHEIGLLGVLGAVLATPSSFKMLRRALAHATATGTAASVAAELSDEPPWGTVRAALLAADRPTDDDRNPWGPDPRLLWPLGAP